MDAIRPQWSVVASCPACGSSRRAECGALDERAESSGVEPARDPEGAIRLYECACCALVYKSPVPASQSPSVPLEPSPEDQRIRPLDYAAEVSVLGRLLGRDRFDLLAAGAPGRDLLAACVAAGIEGRRSALYSVRDPGPGPALFGECIEDSLDSPALAWSGAPYDVVAALNVLERLSSPFVAFVNLRALTRLGGLVLIETGDAGSEWPERYGLQRWWHAHVVEHRVFWSRRALEHCAGVHGMELLHWEPVRQKSRCALRAPAVARDLAKLGLYRLMPSGYARLAALFGRTGSQPCSPTAQDHFRAVLRRT